MVQWYVCRPLLLLLLLASCPLPVIVPVQSVDSCCIFNEESNVTHENINGHRGRVKVRHLDCRPRTLKKVIDWCFTCHSDECFVFENRFTRYESNSVLRYGESPPSHQLYPGCHDYKIDVPGTKKWIHGTICFCNHRPNCNDHRSFFHPPGPCKLHMQDDWRVDCTIPTSTSKSQYISTASTQAQQLLALATATIIAQFHLDLQ